MEDVPLVTHARAAVHRPVDLGQQFVDLVDERVGVGAVEAGGARVGEPLDRAAQIGPPVADDRHAHHQCRDRVRPPQPQADPEHPDDRGQTGLPVGAVHGGVGVEHLVVQRLGRCELHPAEDERPDDRQRHHHHHQPPGPDDVPADFHHPQRGTLAGDQPGARVDDEEHAHDQKRHAGHEVPDVDRPVMPVREPRARRDPGHAYGHEERDRRQEGQRVLDPRRLHRLRLARHRVHGRDRHGENGEGHPLQPDRASQCGLLLLG